MTPGIDPRPEPHPHPLADPPDAPALSAEMGIVCFWLAFGCIGAVACAWAIGFIGDLVSTVVE